MEVITIESKAFAALVEKIDGIAAYVEESRQREQDGQQGQEEKNSRTTGKWMTGSEVCEYLEISPRTLQRYRTNRIIASPSAGRKSATAARTWNSSGNGGCGKRLTSRSTGWSKHTLCMNVNTSCMVRKEEILARTSNGLDVFRHYLPVKWRVGRNFLNPLYEDSKASCNVYYDRRSGTYRMKDFGNGDFSGDCFFIVAKIKGLDCKNAADFVEILETIDRELCLGISEDVPPETVRERQAAMRVVPLAEGNG